jgi:hypothetical protein
MPIALYADRSHAWQGELVHLTVVVKSSGAQPVVTWSSTQGLLRVEASSRTAILDTSSVGSGTISVTATVASNGCPGLFDIAMVQVLSKRSLTPQQQAQIVSVPAALFRQGRSSFSCAVRDELDKVALRLQSEPKTKLLLDGFSLESEGADLAIDRADAIRSYLDDKRGVNKRRIEIRWFHGRCPAPAPQSPDNTTGPPGCRVDIHIIGEGVRLGDVVPICGG